LPVAATELIFLQPFLDGLQARVEDLRRLQNETQAEIEAMTSAVLAKAFRGDL
jgi:hypothetical protein